MNQNGRIVHEGPNHVVIATGFTRKSANSKTGDLIQLWILTRRDTPVYAIQTGSDKAVCGDCELRGTMGERQCYVNVSKAPLGIWRCYDRGNYPVLAFEDIATVFAGRKVRFGAYGEPVLIPFKLVEAIAQASAGFTGYTHQWAMPWNSAYKRYLMASCNASNYQQARAQGWRTFVVSEKHLPNVIQCPASQERGFKLTCEQCLLCSGTSRFARDVQIQPHGQNVARNFAIAA